ncbi:MAG TPA: AAA family ATPase, partial [Actinomycetota bacterium]|nr:AAA family ATPase [Actinomycetota bacterium]
MGHRRREGVSIPIDELKPVTALFADIVGSTSLGERLTPGEVKALIGECVNRMSRAVEEFGGTIQAYTGDGICAYFGVPMAHEDDPVRAALAGLRILELAREYARDVEGAWDIKDFDVRVGINSGQTGVGLVGSAAPQAVALGDATNVAARLEGAADPGTIAVGPETARQLASGFVLESLGPLAVKGRAEPVTAWRLIGSRPEKETGPLAPLVGREPEMARLARVLDELRAGRGQIVFVSGEAGIGKTRLITELRALAEPHVTWLGGTCVSYEQDLAAGPFVQIVRSWLGLDQGEHEVAVRMRLRAKLGALLGPNAADVLPGLARLLSVKVDAEAENETALAPAEQAGRLHRAYRAWVEAVAASRPLVIAVDDLHWADPTGADLIGALLDLPDRMACMIVAAFRPDRQSPAWGVRVKGLADFPHRTVELPLGPLSDDACHQLFDLLLPTGGVDDVTREGMIARSEGNPLFLEELLRNLQEAGAGDGSRSWSVSIRHLLPPSLESLLVARIDRLPPGPRQLMQLAAVVGREFPVRVLEWISENENVGEDLGILLHADLVREVRRFPELVCAFRHGLIQEAALETLTADHLRHLNGRVAAAYEALFAGALDDHLDVLAYHYYRSDDQSKAMGYLEQAADRALARDDRLEAAELLRRARKVAGRLGDEGEERRLS